MRSSGFFIYADERTPIRSRSQQLTKICQLNRSFLQVTAAPFDQVKTRTGRFDTDVQEAPAQAEIESKRERRELIDFPQVSSGESRAQLFDNMPDEILLHDCRSVSDLSFKLSSRRPCG